MDFIESFRASFNDSANFMTWAFYALITAYVGMVLNQLDEFKTRYRNFMSLAIFVIAMFVFIPNLYFLSEVFRKNIGNGAGVLAFIIGMMMLFIHTVPAIYSLAKKTESKK